MTDRPSILVPIRVLDGESIPDGVPELLANAHVVLLGYHVVPDQTATGQAKMQFEERANRRLDRYESTLEEAGATVERRLVFTHDGQKTLDRVRKKCDCLAVLVPNGTSPPDDVLVAVRGTAGVSRLADAVAGLFGSTDVTVTMYHVTETNETDDDIETFLDGVKDRLTSKGMARSAIETRVDPEQKRLKAIATAAEEYDALVMGESDPSLATFVFGMPAEQIADRFLGPVLVVQREHSESS
ncbi:universal stress protein [Haloarcula salinisoli]|uniref:Universal stress protein n=1 Tax=Haloarcula salinisoli TaxID=2487746 RepID=A0A8J7YDD6_9EURY|nr:universal stress protein [Halomicroarcula salinisoli]MBX0285071.1 universal stress protein [Halomicroarcula salinisoli]MBX0303452.1 universal stress protein [Halomicroarcula salinisoli]